jgi:hypothetical protein
LDGAGLLDGGFGIHFAGDECVGDFLKSVEDGVLITESHFITEGFGASIFAHKLATVKERAREGWQQRSRHLRYRR